MAIPIEVPVGWKPNMPEFVYMPESVMHESAVVDHQRESSCKCVGEDCGDSVTGCSCIAKNGGMAPYTADGQLTDIMRTGGREVIGTSTLKCSLAVF